MATHNFQIFDEYMSDIDTDAEYLAESQRIHGVTPGLASPEMHNKLYRQCSVMAYAIASVVAARGYNATDSDPAALIDAIQRTFAFSVNGNTPNASGAITSIRPLDAWPVGSVFITMSTASPATLLGGGTWVKIEGKYIVAADSNYTVDGATTYGANTKNVPLVSHSHTFTTGSAGSHSHDVTGDTGGAGSHAHGGGNLKVVGTFGTGASTPSLFKADTSGAFTNAGTDGKKYASGNTSTNDRTSKIKLDTAGHWSGKSATVADHTHEIDIDTSSAGAHTHGGTTASAGTSASFDVRPLTIAVYMWRRTA